MPEIQWLQIGAALLGGGAFGAVITKAYDRWNGRQQPILTRIEVDRVFSSTPFDSDLQAIVNVIESPSIQSNFSNLSLIKIEISNIGNADRDTFDFGVTLPTTHRMIRCDCTGNDRHHNIVCAKPPSLGNQCSEADYCCKPFNRKDAYVLKVYVTSDAKAIQGSDVKVSSAAAVRIIKSPHGTERPLMGTIVGLVAAAISGGVFAAVCIYIFNMLH